MVNDDIIYSQNVINRFLFIHRNNLYVEVQNYNNFNHLAGILTNVILNIDKKNNYMELNYSIIFIAEKTFFKNKENYFNKIYLCSLLSKNKMFYDKNFWTDLFDYRLFLEVEKKSTLELNRLENEYSLMKKNSNKDCLKIIVNEKKSNYTKNKISSNLTKLNSTLKIQIKNEDNLNDKNPNSLISNPKTPLKTSPGPNSLMNKVKNFFSSNNSNKSSNKNLNNIYMKNSNSFSNEIVGNKENIFYNLKKIEANNLIIEFLSHFCNFNFDVSDSNDLILEFSIKYLNDEEKVKLFMTCLNSNMFTIKNNSKKFPLVILKNSTSDKYSKKLLNCNDNNLIIFISSLNYLNNADLINLLLINNNYKKKLSKIIYTNIILYHLDNDCNNYYNKPEFVKKLRLEIWNSCLSIVKIIKLN